MTEAEEPSSIREKYFSPVFARGSAGGFRRRVKLSPDGRQNSGKAGESEPKAFILAGIWSDFSLSVVW